MINEDIRKFADFLDYYKDDYAKPSWKISLPNPEDEDYDADEMRPLVTSDYIMLDFDKMCKDADFYPKRTKDECNRPATVDGLYYRILEENKIELLLVEFKSFYFNWDKDIDYDASLRKVKQRLESCGFDHRSSQGFHRLESIKKTFGNTIEFSLKLKPYESLFVVLPKLYDEYCDEKNISECDKINLYDLFKSDLFVIKLFVVGKTYDEDINSAYIGKLANTLDKQFKRLDFVNVLTPHPQRLCFEWEFDDFASKLLLHEEENIKSLNFEGV